MNPNRQVHFNGKYVVLLGAALVISAVWLPTKGMAQNVTMRDGGSTATLNLGGGTGNLGMNSWTVLGGQNQLDQQWFWYSINGAPQQSIDNLSAASWVNVNGNPNLNDLGVTYANSQLEVDIEYVLSGNGVNSGSADMTENINLVNNGQSSISVSFYQYSNFNLLENNQNSVTISGSPGAYTGATQTTSDLTGNGIAELIDAPYANYAEAASITDLGYQTRDELNSGSYYTLNDTTSAGPGDVTWAFQWVDTITPGGSLSITKDKGLSIQLVPEPSTLALIGLGLGALGLTLRRKLA